MAVTTVRNTASDPVSKYVNRASGTLSDGTFVAAAEEGNTIRIYTSPDSTTWTLRQTITPAHDLDSWSISVAPNNNLALAYIDYTWSGIGTPPRVYYYLLTYSAGPAWAVGAEEQIVAYSNIGSATGIDIDFTAANVPVIAITEVDNSITPTAFGVGLYIRKTGTNTWARGQWWALNIQDPLIVTFGQASLCIDRLTGGTTAIPFCIVAYNGWHATKSPPRVVVSTFNSATGAVAADLFSDRTIHTSEPDTVRDYRVFSPGANLFDLGCLIGSTELYCSAARVGLTGATWGYKVGWTNSGHVTYAAGRSSTSYNRAGFMYLNNTMLFLYSSTLTPYIVARYAACRFSNTLIRWLDIGGAPWSYLDLSDTSGNNVVRFVTSMQANRGGNPLFGGNPIEVGLFFHLFPSRWTAYRSQQYAPTTLSYPVDGSTVTTDLPSIQYKRTATSTSLAMQQKIKVQIQLAKDAGFTTSLKTILQDDTAYQRLTTYGRALWNLIVDAANALDQGTWYMRVRGVDLFGAVSAWNATTDFIDSHPPSSVPLVPSGDAYYAYGTGNGVFVWSYSDASSTSIESAYRVLIERNDTGAVVADTGKVAGSVRLAVVNIPAAQKDQPLRWSMWVWDDDDVISAQSDYSLFRLGDSPGLAITAPTDGSTINTSKPVIAWTFTPAGTRTQAKYKVDIYLHSDSSLLWSSGWISGTATAYSGESDSIMKNNTQYDIVVSVEDTGGLSTSATSTVTTSWVAPLAPDFSLDFSLYNGSGYGIISWDTAKVADYPITWRVYRRLTGTSTWTLAIETSSTIPGNEFNNGDLETGATTDWTATTNASIAIDATQFYSGTKSLKITATGAGNTVVSYDPKTPTPGAGTRYTVPGGSSFSVRIRSLALVTPRNVTLTVTWKDSVTNAVKATWNSTATLEVTGQWTQVYVYGTLPANANSLYPVLSITHTGAAAAEVHYVDVAYGFYSVTKTVRDYLVGSNNSYDYSVVQVASVVSATVESAYNSQSVTPYAEDYWLIPLGVQDADSSNYWSAANPIFPVRLSNVNQDDWSEEYEKVVLGLIGRGRKVDYGTRFGYTGSLSAQLFTDAVMTARAKRLQLQIIKANEEAVYLRNPFGDVWKVDIGDPDFSRMPGVGNNEFQSVSISYQEVV